MLMLDADADASGEGYTAGVVAHGVKYCNYCSSCLAAQASVGRHSSPGSLTESSVGSWLTRRVLMSNRSIVESKPLCRSRVVPRVFSSTVQPEDSLDDKIDPVQVCPAFTFCLLSLASDPKIYREKPQVFHYRAIVLVERSRDPMNE